MGTASRIAAVVLAAWLAAACSGSAAVDPAATPVVACTGIPAAKCDEAVASAARSFPNEHPARVDVDCQAPPCTDASGTMVTSVTMADGRRLVANPVSWFDPNAPGGAQTPGPAAKPEPVPGGRGVAPLRIAPICRGVPFTQCRDMAASFAEPDAGHGVPVAITVTCTKNPCTDTTGEGDVVITYADGTQTTGGWGYTNGG
jgi:hypothetical protein